MRKSIFGHLPNVKNERGMAIATVMVVVAILALLGTGLLLMSMREMNISLKSESSNQAFHVAEAGIDYAINKVLDGEILADFSDTKTFGPGEFEVDVVRAVDYTSPPQVTYTITSIGIVEDSQATQTSWLPSLINKVIPVAFASDNQKTLQVEMRQINSFVEYVYFMDEKRDANNYNFISYKKSGVYVGDEVTGTVHADGYDSDVFNLTEDPYDLSIYSVADEYPLFNGLVTYVNGIKINNKVYTTYPNDLNPPYPEPDFNPDPVQVNDDEATFPVTNDYTFLRNKAGSNWVFNGNTTITLEKDSLIISNVNKGSSTPSLSSGNGVLYVEDGDVEVSGILDGRLTIVSTLSDGNTTGGNIKIVNDLTYKDGVVPLETANDMLGLIAEKDIYIPYKNALSNISINGVMVAKTGSIWYESYSDGSKMYVAKGVVTINGSLIQKTDYGDISGGLGKGGKHFGYTWGMPDDKVKIGYYKKLNYDKRLHYLEPPYFFKPDRSLYEITWRQK